MVLSCPSQRAWYRHAADCAGYPYRRWRLRGLLQWKRSLKHEFKELKDELHFAGPCRQQAIQVVLDRCKGIWQAGFPEINELSGFAEYLRNIAAAFHPDQEKPELCVTSGSLIRASHSAVERLQNILRRPGFSRFRNIRIRHIRKAWNWYDRISRYRVVQAYIRYRRWINRANILRLILLQEMDTVYRLSQESYDRRQTEYEKSRKSEERGQKLLTPAP